MSDKPDPKFTKVTTNENVSHLKPVNKVEVEKEVLDATEEGKCAEGECCGGMINEDAGPANFEPRTTGPVKLSMPLVTPDISPESKDTIHRIGMGESTLPTSVVKANAAKLKEFNDTPPNPKMANMRLVRELRQKDRSFNKTCAGCARRVPLDKIGGGKSEICDDCRSDSK